MSDVSVLVPSYGRPSSLARCLLAIDAQDTSPRQLVVVARRQDAATRAVADSNPAVTTVLVDRTGVAHAVEQGIAACTSRVVALTDDDSEPRLDWISRIDAAYEARPDLGAFGGRDVVVGDDDNRVPSSLVGRVTWFGRITGFHHRGEGAAVEVDHLKGVNLTVLRSVVAAIPLTDRTRGHGAQYGFELQLCLAARAQGLVVVYDPALQVIHHAARRIDGSAREVLGIDQITADVHNVMLAVRAELPLRRAAAVAAWSLAIGERKRPGILRALVAVCQTRTVAPLHSFAAAMQGVSSGWRLGSPHSERRLKRNQGDGRTGH